MNSKVEPIRDRIITTADDLFYRQGFNHTSFTDIANAVGISRGNFYYHFKTKDDILAAVIENRKAGIESMLQQWTACSESAHERLYKYIDMIVGAQDEIVKYGCPVGSACSELIKLKNINYADATEMISLFRDWMVKQVMALGYSAEESDHHAMHLLTCTQGISLIGQAFKDANYIQRETAELKQWISQL